MQGKLPGFTNIFRCNIDTFLNLLCCISQDSSAPEDLQTDAGACIKELLYTESDLTVTPIMDNPKVSTTLKFVSDMKISTSKTPAVFRISSDSENCSGPI